MFSRSFSSLSIYFTISVSLQSWLTEDLSRLFDISDQNVTYYAFNQTCKAMKRSDLYPPTYRHLSSRDSRHEYCLTIFCLQHIPLSLF